jgi:hypothetical protein
MEIVFFLFLLLFCLSLLGLSLANDKLKLTHLITNDKLDKLNKKRKKVKSS